MSSTFLRRATALRWLGAAALGLAPWVAQACVDGGIDADAEGGHVFIAANAGAPFGGLVPFTGGYNLSCGSAGYEGLATAPTAGGGTAGISFSASASGGGASVHSRSSSSVLGGGTLLSRNTTPAIFADAATVLRFKVSDGGATLRFDIAGDGNYHGSPGPGGIAGAGGTAGFSSSVRSGAAGVVSNIGSYRDSNGVSYANTTLQFQAVQSMPTSVDYAIAYTANFYGGEGWLQLDLYTYAWGDAVADFSNTARIVGVTVLTAGADVALPPDLFTADPNRPGHYLLSALQPVPEPASALLLAAGLAALGARRYVGGRTAAA